MNKLGTILICTSRQDSRLSDTAFRIYVFINKSHLSVGAIQIFLRYDFADGQTTRSAGK